MLKQHCFICEEPVYFDEELLTNPYVKRAFDVALGHTACVETDLCIACLVRITQYYYKNYFDKFVDGYFLRENEGEEWHV